MCLKPASRRSVSLFPRHFCLGPIEAWQAGHYGRHTAGHFRDIFVSAPLKLAVYPEQNLRILYFRDIFVSAPLKRLVMLTPARFLTLFPRHFCLGPIEAMCLKPASRRSVSLFPRHFCLGPIEAWQAGHYGRHTAGHFRDIFVSAPLKLAVYPEQNLRILYFRDIFVSAPLKRLVMLTPARFLTLFPRHFCLGPIEARLGLAC